ncbi:hemerythrin domain-containing protein, partial [Sphingobium sp.]|uniref:hemerythrin domain-containing protein n=1 Tax=Sphingobium sp. TaxID=1912891 RepID=UPI0028BD8096
RRPPRGRAAGGACPAFANRAHCFLTRLSEYALRDGWKRYMDLDELRRQHDEIEALTVRFRQAIADDGNPQRLGTLRWQFARLLMAHLALEDRIFYPNMQRQAHARLRDTAARLEIEMAPIANDFSAYMSRWSDDRIEREWADFCRESREILNVILKRMHKEERLLMPLLADAGLVEAPRMRRAG